MPGETSERTGIGDDIRERTVAVGDVDLHLLEAGDDGPLVVLAHGFPELGWSWRHQLPALAEAGYRVIAPDQRGYGRSSRPEALADYDIFHLTGDLVGLLDHLDEEQATFAGHDWGSMVVWNLALLHPERVRGVCGMSVPFPPRPPMPPVQLMRAAFADSFFYIVYFQEPGVADAELGADPRRTMYRMLCGLASPDELTAEDATAFAADDDRGFVDRIPTPDGLPDWLTQAELDHYVAEFERTGFTGGINWYRNLDRNWELTEHLDGAHVKVPSLFIGGADDPVLAMTPPEIQDPFLDDHRGSVVIDGAGHWVQQEAPEPVNAALLGFLDELHEGNQR
ncbi:MAG: alpha/beta hydrolase [Acidimicrobiales bacterium]|nr:alpha/beta hydrolase [Acidimicrobiales bacterium]